VKTKSVTVRVPASTSNLGSGFDTLGLALKLYNRVQVTRVADYGLSVGLSNPEANADRVQRMLSEAASLFFRRSRRKMFGIAVKVTGDVPVGRGLGASATARLGLVAALNELSRARLSRQQLLEIVSELEGHPDNASPAIFGGFTVSGPVSKTVRCLSFRVSSRLKFVTLIPRFEISTEHARKLVPSTFSKADAVHSLNRAALITAAFASANYESLRGLFDDRVHQPHRERLIPQLSRVIRAGEKASAVGGFLSGSGSAIICLTSAKPEAVAQAMQRQLPDSEVKVLTADNRGFMLEF
jgi:homoserine kinase